MRVERAGLEDVADVVALERATAEAPHWPEAEYRAAAAGGDERLWRCLFVARDKGKLLGFAAGRVVAEVAELESVAVRACARRGGVGRALCGAVIAWTWEQGALTVQLEVRAGSAGARALYAGLGFAERGRREGYYGGPVEDAVLMRLWRVGQKE